MATDLEQLTLRIEANTRGVDRALKTLNKNLDGQFRAMETRSTSFEKHLSAVGRSAMGVFATFGAGLGAMQLAQGLASTALEMDRVNKALTVATGSGAAARAEFEFIRATANSLGLELMSTAQQYAFLAAAAKGTALEGQATRDIFVGVATAASSLGLTAADTAGVLNAVQQMISKGVVSAEELRGQMGERLPGAFQAAANAMGMTTQELGKQLELGNIMAADLLPKLAQELMKLGDAAGTGLQAELNRLNNAWTDLMIAFGDTGAIQIGISGLQALTEGLSNATLGAKLLADRWAYAQAKIAAASDPSKMGYFNSNATGPLYRGNISSLFAPAPPTIDATTDAPPSFSKPRVGDAARASAAQTAAKAAAKRAASAAAAQAKREAAEAARDAKQYATAVSELNFDLSLLAMTTEAASYAQRLHSNLQRAGVELDTERGAKVAELTAQMWDQEQAIEAVALAQEQNAERALQMSEMWGTLGDMAAGALDDIIVKGEDAGQVIGRLLLKIAEMIALQSISGQGPFSGVWGDIFGRAGGGPVNRGQPYLVGEQGPELMIPQSAGRIVPRGQMGGGGTSINFTSVINAPGANPATLALMDQMLSARDAKLRREMPSLIADRQRRNQMGGAFR